MRCVVLLLLLALQSAERPDPAELLRVMDSARPPGVPTVVELTLTTIEGGESAQRRYRVVDNGVDRAVVEFLDPLERGQKILSTPDEMWFISARTRRAIRIPPAQRLFGEASYGDLAQARWSRDYVASYDALDQESLNGEPCWRLRLNALSSSATYSSILLWIVQSTGVPRRAFYYTASGKLLKSADFPDSRRVSGGLQNPTWILHSPDSPARRTVLTIDSTSIAKHPPSHFTRRHLELNP